MRFPGHRKGSNTKPAASVGTEKPHSRLLRNRRLLLAGVAALWLLLDQLTKAWAVNALDDRSIHLFWTLRFKLVFNEGAIFGLGSSLAPYITALVVIVSLLIVGSTWRNESRFVAVVAGLVLGGALGNLGDRAFRGDGGVFSGKVIDFIDLQWWPVFNVADSGITIGVLLFVSSAFLARKANTASGQKSDANTGGVASASQQVADNTADGQKSAPNTLEEVAEIKDKAANRSSEHQSNHFGIL